MRCKEGDLAMIVGPQLAIPAMAGTLVIVERLLVPGEAIVPGRWYHQAEDPATWWVRAYSGRRLPWMLAEGCIMEVWQRPFFDHMLKPIRDDQGEDETLTWAPLEVAHG